MSPTIALIPAKRRSDGVPGKNWRPITPEGVHCVDLAVRCAYGAAVDRVMCSTDLALDEMLARTAMSGIVIQRPPDLPDTMLAVVQDALQQVPGPDDEIIVLLQPTSPLRTADTVRQAIQMLEARPDAESVVSVSPSYPYEWSLVIDVDVLAQAYSLKNLDHLPTRRQDCRPTYRRDGVVYAFRRRVLAQEGNIYGNYPLPLFTPHDEALSIDTPADWEEAVRRLHQMRASASVGQDVGASR
jgi:CMP-N,N'-diacetyllegionaminic acid synthase